MYIYIYIYIYTYRYIHIYIYIYIPFGYQNGMLRVWDGYVIIVISNKPSTNSPTQAGGADSGGLVLITGYENGMLRVWDGINSSGVKREWLTFKTPGAEAVASLSPVQSRR